MKRKRLDRVDLQVGIFVAAIVIISFCCVYFCNYYFTYKDMINSLNERAQSIHQFVDQSFDKSTFHEIDTKEDERKSSYQEMKSLLSDVKCATGVKYLYTAKQNEKGNFIYIIDGLSEDDPDFRYAGDLMEPEMHPELKRALMNEIVMPEKIKSTNWGHVFVCYFPIHEDEKVVGVLGIEFDADHQYRTFLSLKIITPLIAVIACICAVIIAFILFRRISNPTFQDLSNTDQLTGVKNRNAFEIDMHNLISKNQQKGKAILSIDLNGLKKVNDVYGHIAGDEYIKTVAEVLKKSSKKDQILYRIGGDEFIIIFDITNDKPEDLINRIQERVIMENVRQQKPLSIAIGCVAYDASVDRSLLETYRRADKEMYRNKQNYYATLN